MSVSSVLVCRVVLVGDPQQLPATILSQKAKDLMLERSLFERLQQGGCPVHTLLVQYRMHPAIRTFPSKHFYQNRLIDGYASQAHLATFLSTEPRHYAAEALCKGSCLISADDLVLSRETVVREPPEVFYSHSLLQPFLFFDVAEGRDVQATFGSNSGSRRNQVCLFGRHWPSFEALLCAHRALSDDTAASGIEFRCKGSLQAK